MTFDPPARAPGTPLRSLLPPSAWRHAVGLVAERHGLLPADLEPYEKGETIVWRAGEHVVKLTSPECQYQIDAEVGALAAVRGRLGVETPELVASGKLSGWPYVVMTRIGGRCLGDFWPALEHADRERLAGDLGALCRRLHELPPDGFRGDWLAFRDENTRRFRERYSPQSAQTDLVRDLIAFLDDVPLPDRALVPLHTELIDQHVYATDRSGRLELSGLLDFADARLGPPEYDFGAAVEFLFKAEQGLLRAFLLGYGKTPAELTAAYSRTLFRFAFCHRFTSLERMVAAATPLEPRSLDELAAALYALSFAPD